jgi:hypothetical protein
MSIILCFGVSCFVLPSFFPYRSESLGLDGVGVAPVIYNTKTSATTHNDVRLPELHTPGKFFLSRRICPLKYCFTEFVFCIDPIKEQHVEVHIQI